MILCLYVMVICFCACVPLYEYGFERVALIVQLSGLVLFFIANSIYTKTITDLKNEIRELKRKIDP